MGRGVERYVLLIACISQTYTNRAINTGSLLGYPPSENGTATHHSIILPNLSTFSSFVSQRDVR